MPMRQLGITLVLSAVLFASPVLARREARAAPTATASRPGCERRVQGPITLAFGQSKPAEIPYQPEHYGDLSERIKRFAVRLRSPDDRTRYQVLGEAGSMVPATEAVALLYAMLADPCSGIRNQAAARLLADGRQIRPEQAPWDFAVDSLEMDWRSPQMRAQELAHLRRAILCPEGPLPGDAAQMLSIHGNASDLPALRALAAHPNAYVRLHAATALEALGDAPAARTLLEKLSTSDEAFYARAARERLARNQDQESR